MWIGLFFLVVLSVAAYLLYASRAERSPPKSVSRTAPAAGLADIPARVFNPSRYKEMRSVLAWEFVVPNLSTACQYAKNHDGVRRQAFECPSLPLADCSSHTCQCHYRPVLDERRRERRKVHDRRGELRLEGGEDRRKLHDRRKDQADWHEKTIR